MRLERFIVMVFVAMCAVDAMNDQCANVKTPLHSLRKRRYLTFPTGTSVVLTLSLLKAIMVHAPSGWNVAIEIDVIFPVASQEMINSFYRKKIHHRQKREFWEKIQNTLDNYNLNGRSCTYRSICEARSLLAQPGKSLVHDILRILFGAPIHEEDFKEEIYESYPELLEPGFCERKHDCPISILDMILTMNKQVQYLLCFMFIQVV